MENNMIGNYDNLKNMAGTKQRLVTLRSGIVKSCVVFVSAFFITSVCYAFETEASYYTYASCIKEGTSGIMANGKVLDDTQATAASWDYRFGTRLLITNKCNGRQVVVSVTDRGPSKRLYKRGRKIDLSATAFKALAPLSKGIIKVEVTKI